MDSRPMYALITCAKKEGLPINHRVWATLAQIKPSRPDSGIDLSHLQANVFKPRAKRGRPPRLPPLALTTCSAGAGGPCTCWPPARRGLLIIEFIEEVSPLLPKPRHFLDYDRSMFPLSLVPREASRTCAHIKLTTKGTQTDFVWKENWIKTFLAVEFTTRIH